MASTHKPKRRATTLRTFETGLRARNTRARPARPAGRGDAAVKRKLRREGAVVRHFQAEKIPLHLPGHVEYERAVASSNLLYRFSRPTYVIQPETAAHVQEVVRVARRRGIPLTIKNGGHSYSGSSFPNNGILLDLKRMNGVRLGGYVEFENETVPTVVTVQGGALWGNVYRALINEDLDGYIVNGGRCPTVGVSGFMLGGGLGPFSRTLGMGVDSLQQLTIVTADGKLVTVKNSDPADSAEGMLFWALCGAGGGNFGVVVELKMAIHELKEERGVVVAGRHTWFPTLDLSRRGSAQSEDDETGLLATMNKFYTTDWPDNITIDSSWFSDLGRQDGDIGVRFLAYCDGGPEDFEEQINSSILNKDLAKQLKRRVLPEASTRFLHETLFAQWDEETKRSTPANSTFRIFSSFCFTNEPESIRLITGIVKEELEAFKAVFKGETSGLCQATFIHSGGETTKKERSATAFRWRECVYHSYITLEWRDKWLERDMRGFCQRFKDRLKPHAIAGKAAFVAFPDAALAEGDYEKAYYGNNRLKLREVKRLWDRGNFFTWDQGIPPSAGGSMQDVENATAAASLQEQELSDADEARSEQTDQLAAYRWNERQSNPEYSRLTAGPLNGKESALYTPESWMFF